MKAVRKLLMFITSVVSLSVMGLLASHSVHAAQIMFETAFNGAAGTISYDGLGGPLVGGNITINRLEGGGTPLNADPLTCLNCVLNFTTGPATSTGNISAVTDNPQSSQYWQFGTGGMVTVTGQITFPGNLSIPAGSLLLSGIFDLGPNSNDPSPPRLK